MLQIERYVMRIALLIVALMMVSGGSSYADLAGRLKRMHPAISTGFRLLSFERLTGLEANGAALAVGEEGSFDSAWVGLPDVHFDGSVYRMWYGGAAVLPMYTGEPSSIGIATSRDGLHWQRANNGRPVLEPGPPGAFDECQVAGSCVLYDGEIWRMWYCGLQKPGTEPRAENWAGVIPESWECRIRIGLATSTDGVHWTRENEGKPVLDLGPIGSTGDLQIMHPTVLKEHDGYRMWYASNSISIPHTISMATSSDGIHWQKYRDGAPVVGLGWYVTGPAVYQLGDEYLMLYSRDVPEADEMGCKGWIVGAAVSRDGFRWRVLNQGRGVAHPGPLPPAPTSGPRPGEEGSTHHPSAMIREGNCLRFWYTENPATGAYRLGAGTLSFAWPPQASQSRGKDTRPEWFSLPE